MVHIFFFFPSLTVELLCYMGFCHAFSLSVHMFLLSHMNVSLVALGSNAHH